MMNFIRDNIVKIGIGLVVIIIVIIVIAACTPKGTNFGSRYSEYTEMENRLQNAAIKYVEKNKRVLPRTTEQVKKLQLSTLISSGAIGELHAIEDSNVTCKGYVEIIKKSEEEEEYRYTPYIKCGKYYETKTIADHIIESEEIVTEGEGLYQIATKVVKTDDKTSEEEKKDEKKNDTETEDVYSYLYRGEYPNNYIKLGERMYRIMEITEDNNLKVISTERTYDMYNWDDRYNTEDNQYSGINDFSKSRIKDHLKFIYSNTNEEEGEIYFSDEERSYIVDHDFCIGKRSENDTNINSEADCKDKAYLKVGLITINDYYRASISSSCDAVGKQECNNYNYLFSLNDDGATYGTLIASADDTYSYYQIDDGDIETIKCRTARRLYPVIYLDSNVLYVSGTGTAEDPYIVR